MIDYLDAKHVSANVAESHAASCATVSALRYAQIISSFKLLSESEYTFGLAVAITVNKLLACLQMTLVNFVAIPWHHEKAYANIAFKEFMGAAAKSDMEQIPSNHVRLPATACDIDCPDHVSEVSLLQDPADLLQMYPVKFVAENIYFSAGVMPVPSHAVEVAKVIAGIDLFIQDDT